jgi:DNA-binding beta-propeller fold protein YncE/mono/diheme cytochrome c family protein
MVRTRFLLGAAAMALAVGATADAGARSKIRPRFKEPLPHFQQVRAFQPDFLMTDPAVGGVKAPAATKRTVSLNGSTIATFAGDLLVVDADSGKLLRTDGEDAVVASIDIGRDAAQIVVDQKHRVAYVSDRRADRIVVVGLDDGLTERDAWRTEREPFGLALSPDGSTLLATSVADGTVTAYSTESGLQRWSAKVGPEPRGVAVSPDGSQALVTFLTMGSVARLKLGADHPTVEYQTLDPAAPTIRSNFNQPFGGAGPLDGDQGRSFARNAFAAIFVGNSVAVVPHQLSTPHLPDGGNERPSSGYGGGSGFQAPITHRLAFFETEGARGSTMDAAFATTSVHQPRAVAYDPGTDTLYVAGYGSDDMMAFANVSQVSVRMAWKATIAPGCGPTGLTVDGDTGNVFAYCSLTRTTAKISKGSQGVGVVSPELAKSHLSAAAQRGREIFRRGKSPKLSQGGAMSCSNCHAEARADGLTWFLQGNTLQTPLLAGRLKGAHPFKWDGKDPTLTASLTNTVKRLGGSGLSKDEVADLSAFLESIEPPRAPTVEDSTAVARGKDLFESDETGCAECHYGKLLTDKKSHSMASDLPEVDTPSLIGLAHSAPYYHDGSAQTLTALLEGKGKIHGMGRTTRLDDAEIDDLVAYLETL